MAAQPELGNRLRALRHESRRSLADVSVATDISASFLSLVETGRADITIGRLMRLVDFYGVHVSDLLPRTERHVPDIVRSSERRHLYSAAEGIDVWLLASDTDRKMMPVMSVIDPGGGLAEFVSSEGEAFVHIVKGSVEVTMGEGEPFVLRRGDTLYFDARVPHSYRNPGKSQAVMLATVTPPSW
jgi:quercetin dioxygenase-like cupin family protein